MEYCYSCGHSEDCHRIMLTITGHARYVDCMKPVAHRMTTLSIKWVDICQCSEFTTKDTIKLEKLEHE